MKYPIIPTHKTKYYGLKKAKKKLGPFQQSDVKSKPQQPLPDLGSMPTHAFSPSAATQMMKPNPAVSVGNINPNLKPAAKPTVAPQPGSLGPPPAYQPPPAQGQMPSNDYNPGHQKSDIDAMVEKYIRDNLSGPRDTSAEEDLARRNIERASSQSLVDSRARMGRMGFGSSGALASIEGNIGRTAGLDAENMINGIRGDARLEADRKAALALDAHARERKHAEEAAKRDAYMALMRDMLGESSIEDQGNFATDAIDATGKWIGGTADAAGQFFDDTGKFLGGLWNPWWDQ